MSKRRYPKRVKAHLHPAALRTRTPSVRAQRDEMVRQEQERVQRELAELAVAIYGRLHHERPRDP